MQKVKVKLTGKELQELHDIFCHKIQMRPHKRDYTGLLLHECAIDWLLLIRSKRDLFAKWPDTVKLSITGFTGLGFKMYWETRDTSGFPLATLAIAKIVEAYDKRAKEQSKIGF